jgi:ribosomal protein S18 acetylase RimI-like enzyme
VASRSATSGCVDQVRAAAATPPVPALLIGRLAVDRRYAGLGIGTALAGHVLASAAELNQKAACRAVVVTALNSNARAWWTRLGFRALDPEDPEQLDLYLDLRHRPLRRPLGRPKAARCQMTYSQ